MRFVLSFILAVWLTPSGHLAADTIESLTSTVAVQEAKLEELNRKLNKLEQDSKAELASAVKTIKGMGVNFSLSACHTRVTTGTCNHPVNKLLKCGANEIQVGMHTGSCNTGIHHAYCCKLTITPKFPG